jgi:hypothetical protein
MRVVRIMTGAVVVLAVTAIGQAYYIAHIPKPAAVLDFPQQVVISRLPGQLGPAVRIGTDVIVRGTKCNRAAKVLEVQTQRAWVTVDPPGTVVPDVRNQSIRKRGCVAREFTNPLPAGVVARTRELITSSGVPCVSWQITGTEQPLDHAYRPATWRTEPFLVCP